MLWSYLNALFRVTIHLVTVPSLLVPLRVEVYLEVKSFSGIAPLLLAEMLPLEIFRSFDQAYIGKLVYGGRCRGLDAGSDIVTNEMNQSNPAIG